MKFIRKMLDYLSAQSDSKGFATGFAVVVALAVLITIFLLPSHRRDVATVCSIIQTAAVVLGLFSLVLIARQIRTTAAQTVAQAAWSKSLSYHQFFGDLVTAEVRDKIIKVAEGCGFKDQHKKGSPISSDAVEKIFGDSSHDSVISAYLDEFEEFCGAIHAGLLDEGYAYCLESNRVIKAWVVFKPYIDASRADTNFRTYLELERIATSWMEKRSIEDAAALLAEAQQTHSRAAAAGVSPRVPS